MRTYWDPRRERRELWAAIDQAFRAARQQDEAPPAPTAVSPPMDFDVTPEAYVVTMDLPGVATSEVEVQVERGTLAIRGRKTPAEVSGEVIRRERAYGTFARLAALPEDADLAEVTATLKAGELVVRIGRRVAAGPRRIEVTAG